MQDGVLETFTGAMLEPYVESLDRYARIGQWLAAAESGSKDPNALGAGAALRLVYVHELGLPLSFHILTTRSDKTRGPNMNSFLSVVRGCQDIMGMLVLGGVFERHPDLRIVCVEADAGWVPHFMYRMDHAYKRHRYWLPAGQELTRLPSEWFSNNIYTTFQDD
jgi:predicted TIM-barrel fold metal-dependent hydrolase